MLFSFDEKTQLTDIELEETDLCYACDAEQDCTFIQALKFGMVYPSAQSISVQYCKQMKVNYD